MHLERIPVIQKPSIIYITTSAPLPSKKRKGTWQKDFFASAEKVGRIFVRSL
jgi:hypothetical protein